jgi:uncharacterized protein YqeY
MTSIQQIKKDKLFAMRGGDTAKVSTLNLLIAEIEKEMKLTGATDLTEDQLITVINRQIKKLDKEIESYLAVRRGVEKQKAEKQVLLSYLPKQLDEDEIREVVAHAVELVVRGEIKNPMQYLGQRLKGKANMKDVQAMVKEYKF